MTTTAADTNDVTVLFVQCGGTIDKCYPRMTKGYAFEFGEFSAAQSILNEEFDGMMNFKRVFVSVCKKDSLDMNDGDRDRIVDAVRSNALKHGTNLIVITHGTDTLIETAKYISRKLSCTEETEKYCIVLTGSMKPAKFINSDAKFNLGCAVSAVQLMHTHKDYGVCVAMNGRIFRCDEVARNQSNGFFVSCKL